MTRFRTDHIGSLQPPRALFAEVRRATSGPEELEQAAAGTSYLHVREPGGVRMGLNSGGRRLFEPDRETRKRTPSMVGTTTYRNLGMPESMMESFLIPGKAGGMHDTGSFNR